MGVETVVLHSTYGLPCGGLPSVRAVLNGVWEYLTAAHVLDGQRETLSVLDLRVGHCLQVGLLDLTVLGPHDLATVVHAHGRLLPAHLGGGGVGGGQVGGVEYV